MVIKKKKKEKKENPQCVSEVVLSFPLYILIPLELPRSWIRVMCYLHITAWETSLLPTGSRGGERKKVKEGERGKRWENKTSKSVSRDWQGEAIGGVQIFIDKVKASDDAVCSSTGRYGNTAAWPDTARNSNANTGFMRFGLRIRPVLSPNWKLCIMK